MDFVLKQLCFRLPASFAFYSFQQMKLTLYGNRHYYYQNFSITKVPSAGKITQIQNLTMFMTLLLSLVSYDEKSTLVPRGVPATSVAGCTSC